MSGRGAERILDAVEWFATTTSSVTYTDFVQALDVPKSSALLLLRLLVARGYVQRLPNNRYVLVRLPGEMLGGGDTWGTILRLADRHLRDAVATIEETGFVAVLDNQRIRYLNKILPKREIRYDRDIVPTRLPHQVASGLVMLADFAPQDLERYLTEAQVPADQWSGILAATEGARADGYYVNLNGVVEGAAGIAAPVRDAHGRTVAAINISGPRDRIIADLDRIRDAVVSVAGAVSNEVAQRKRK
ncbi:IclR family transcriptional regulator C-terminal domain-containing protein [Mesorhizobium sp. YR577]|uniref:IclR family transcriptional regulator n=1 Tax=Mesorhizobium sp. YR577 TaxID=1884373 RepID=UPI0008DEB00B|nr:IclR family transcriptional regulator C-terminal domain-containing protein [Mesorhizobium sp. YR577]SFU16468.1 transcriptional regulator, IclR family [Mesorhizobium sp. YR577]